MNKPAGMILVTGGMFIGSNFVRHLLSAHPAVQMVNLDKLTYGGNPRNLADFGGNERCVFVRGDICDKRVINDILETRGVEGIVHFAAESHVRLTASAPLLLRHVEDRRGHDRCYALDSTKTRDELDWSPAILFDEGLRRVVEWYHDHEVWWRELLTGEERRGKTVLA